MLKNSLGSRDYEMMTLTLAQTDRMAENAGGVIDAAAQSELGIVALVLLGFFVMIVVVIYFIVKPLTTAKIEENKIVRQHQIDTEEALAKVHIDTNQKAALAANHSQSAVSDTTVIRSALMDVAAVVEKVNGVHEDIDLSQEAANIRAKAQRTLPPGTRPA